MPWNPRSNHRFRFWVETNEISCRGSGNSPLKPTYSSVTTFWISIALYLSTVRDSPDQAVPRDSLRSLPKHADFRHDARMEQMGTGACEPRFTRPSFGNPIAEGESRRIESLSLFQSRQVS